MLEPGSKLNWTRDNKIFDRYQLWKAKVEMIFSSALADCTPEQKTSYLRYWMGDQGIPLVKKWTPLANLTFLVQREEETDPSCMVSLSLFAGHWSESQEGFPDSLRSHASLPPQPLNRAVQFLKEAQPGPSNNISALKTSTRSTLST